MNPQEKLAAKRFNERLKLFCAAASNLAVGTLAGAVIVPAVNAQAPGVSVHWIWIPAAAALHLIAQAALGFLRREE